MRTILCVEDEPQILENHRDFLTQRGFRVLMAENMSRARSQLSCFVPDAVILDIMLPDGNGLDILRELRDPDSELSQVNARLFKTPVIMLTAWGEPKDISHGYRLGATAYISKPFDYEALIAVMESIFSNAEQVPERINRGGLTLDILSGQAFLNGKDLLLTQKEFALLLLFIHNENMIMRKEYIYQKVWKASFGDSDRTLKTHVSNLRRRIEGGGYRIEAKRGTGYCFRSKVENNLPWNI
jgi:DNA-binding response OmpR family regulator